jgi:hypothetical protein
LPLPPSQFCNVSGKFSVQKSVQSDSITGIFSIAAFIIIYSGFCVSLMHRVFALIHIIPASVLRWVGAQWQSQFDQGNQMGQELHQGAESGFNQGKGIVQSGVSAAMTRKNRRLENDANTLIASGKNSGGAPGSH